MRPAQVSHPNNSHPARQKDLFSHSFIQAAKRPRKPVIKSPSLSALKNTNATASLATTQKSGQPFIQAPASHLSQPVNLKALQAHVKSISYPFTHLANRSASSSDDQMAL